MIKYLCIAGLWLGLSGAVGQAQNGEPGGGQCEPQDDPASHGPVLDNSRIIEVPSDGIERYMHYAPVDPALPKVIQGLWWMDGNPLGDILTTFANSSWNPLTRTAQLTVYGEGNYSFRSGDGARRAYNGTSKTLNTYVVQFNTDYTEATLTPTRLENGRIISVPDYVTKYTMRLVGDGHWVRESYLYGIRIPDYQLRRIVRVDGQRDAAYADYVHFASTYSYLVSHF